MEHSNKTGHSKKPTQQRRQPEGSGSFFNVASEFSNFVSSKLFGDDGHSQKEQKKKAPLFVITRLCRAAEHGNVDELKLLVEQTPSATLNECGWLGFTPLHICCRQGHEQCARVLIEEGGARVDVMDSEGQAASLHTTPLHFACAGGHLGCVKLLLANGADPDPVDTQNYSPLMMAVLNNRLDVVQLLLQKRRGDSGEPAVNVNLCVDDENCWSPLHAAMACNLESIARVLLDSGADVQLKDGSGRTPLQYASKKFLLKSAIQLDADRENALAKRSANEGTSGASETGSGSRVSSSTVPAALDPDADPDEQELEQLLQQEQLSGRLGNVDEKMDQLMAAIDSELSVESIGSSIDDSGDELVGLTYGSSAAAPALAAKRPGSAVSSSPSSSSASSSPSPSERPSPRIMDRSVQSGVIGGTLAANSEDSSSEESVETSALAVGLTNTAAIEAETSSSFESAETASAVIGLRNVAIEESVTSEGS